MRYIYDKEDQTLSIEYPDFCVSLWVQNRYFKGDVDYSPECLVFGQVMNFTFYEPKIINNKVVFEDTIQIGTDNDVPNWAYLKKQIFNHLFEFVTVLGYEIEVL